ncbi:MAG TPA: hypothetical protein PKW66_27275, partial [Polyangiaceae bacterium]|nr:hypothetical protein [Polyangiaceae bacterium]
AQLDVQVQHALLMYQAHGSSKAQPLGTNPSRKALSLRFSSGVLALQTSAFKRRVGGSGSARPSLRATLRKPLSLTGSCS